MLIGLYVFFAVVYRVLSGCIAGNVWLFKLLGGTLFNNTTSYNYKGAPSLIVQTSVF